MQKVNFKKASTGQLLQIINEEDCSRIYKVKAYLALLAKAIKGGKRNGI